MSMKLTPAAATLTRTCPACGSGTEIFSRTSFSGPPVSLTRMAFMRLYSGYPDTNAHPGVSFVTASGGSRLGIALRWQIAEWLDVEHREQSARAFVGRGRRDAADDARQGQTCLPAHARLVPRLRVRV